MDTTSINALSLADSEAARTGLLYKGMRTSASRWYVHYLQSGQTSVRFLSPHRADTRVPNVTVRFFLAPIAVSAI
jgi:hypothetical protein